MWPMETRPWLTSGLSTPYSAGRGSFAGAGTGGTGSDTAGQPSRRALSFARTSSGSTSPDTAKMKPPGW